MSKSEKAFILPLAVFLAFLGLWQVMADKFEGYSSPWLATPQYWIFPLQSVVCGILLWAYRSHYPLGLRKPVIGIGAGLLIFALWIAPQLWLGAAPRLEGFNPYALGDQKELVWGMIATRFFRLVVIVPFAEEIFWRGYLLRTLIDSRFTRVPIGTFSWPSCLVVTVAFMLVHQPVDYQAAFLSGLIFNWVAYRTKSLAACVLAHAVANAALGTYILATKQWGFW